MERPFPRSLANRRCAMNTHMYHPAGISRMQEKPSHILTSSPQAQLAEERKLEGNSPVQKRFIHAAQRCRQGNSWAELLGDPAAICH